MSFTQIPDLLIDAKNLDCFELAAAVVIARKTIGWGKTSDGISLTQFMEHMKVSKPTAIKAIAGLISKRVVEKAYSFKDNGGQSFNKYSFTKSFVDEANAGRLDGDTPVNVVYPPSKGGLHPLSTSFTPPVKEVYTQDKAITKETRQDKDIYPTAIAVEKKANADDAPAIELTSLQDAIPENLHFDKPVRFQSEWMEFECMKETFRTCFAEYEIQPMKRHWNLIADKFVDYWNTNATKAKKFENQDWRATFRNYCRDQLERHSQSWKREQKNQPNHANVINHPSMEKLTPKGQAGLAVAMRWLENQQTKSDGLTQ